MALWESSVSFCSDQPFLDCRARPAKAVEACAAVNGTFSRRTGKQASLHCSVGFQGLSSPED